MFKFTLFLGAAVIALGFVTAPSFAQDWRADPVYGSEQLTTGFTPDPYQFDLTAGGSIDASDALGGNCTGFIAEAPDFNLYYEAGDTFPLAISVNSNSDTTLVINAPDGRWYCDDDSGEGLNAALVFEDPDSGLYSIWVGTYGSQTAPAVLAVSELSSY